MIEKIKLSKIKSALIEDYDIFICSSSFEDRSFRIAQKLKGKNFKEVIVIENKNGGEILKSNTQKIIQNFGKKSNILSVDFQDTLAFVDSLNNVLRKFKRKIKILVDITTFSHEILMVCLKLFHLRKDIIKNVVCLYLNAKEYCPNSEFNNKWLSYGCGALHPILGFSGLLMPSQKNRLILIVGYEYERALSVISTLEPSELTLIYGSPDKSTTEKDKDANKKFSKLVESTLFEYPNKEQYEISCDDPDEAASALTSLYRKYEGENIIVIPMNNKLSTVGIVNSLLENDMVQACYAPAIIYNESNYSSCGDSCYIYKFI